MCFLLGSREKMKDMKISSFFRQQDEPVVRANLVPHKNATTVCESAMERSFSTFLTTEAREKTL